jgi:hypothetical protein
MDLTDWPGSTDTSTVGCDKGKGRHTHQALTTAVSMARTNNRPNPVRHRVFKSLSCMSDKADMIIEA